MVRGKVKEGHRTFAAFQPKIFMQSLFSKVQILEHQEPAPEKGKWLPQDIWIIKKINMIISTLLIRLPQQVKPIRFCAWRPRLYPHKHVERCQWGQDIGEDQINHTNEFPKLL